LVTSVRPANRVAAKLLVQRGYTIDPHEPWNLLNIRTLNDLDAPEVPEGFALSTMADVSDVDERVVVHRASWDGSRMTAARFRGVMATWPYDPDLDCVVAAPDGRLVASALVWFDPDLRLGELEPVGTHQDYRRLGLGRAVNLFALQRLRDAGATEAIVACRGDDDYPVPRRLYRSVGFRELSRQVPYIKTLR
jgi:ribosomal protein S18 acetylase RimI-like enzyme